MHHISTTAPLRSLTNTLTCVVSSALRPSSSAFFAKSSVLAFDNSLSLGDCNSASVGALGSCGLTGGGVSATVSLVVLSVLSVAVWVGVSVALATSAGTVVARAVFWEATSLATDVGGVAVAGGADCAKTLVDNDKKINIINKLFMNFHLG